MQMTLHSAISSVHRSSRIKRLKTAIDYVGLSRSTIYRLMKLGQFPTPLRLGPNSIGWDTADLDAWLDAKKGDRASH
jgi:prophage regulatory protein